VQTRALVTLVLLALGLAAGAVAAPPGKPPARIVFPVIGPAQYGDDFGDPRPQGTHEGIDIVSAWKAPAVAAEAGKVALETNARAGCMLRLYGVSGTEYVYIHLNNDLTPRNDNGGRCVAGVAYPKGLRTGATVTAGQPVGYVGNSGDAEGGQPHLHFEMYPGGTLTNPYTHLRRAQRLLFYAREGSPFTLALTGTVAALEGERLRLRVDVLRWWPAGLRVTKLNRTLGIDAFGVEIERKKTALYATAALDGLLGRRVTVWTMPTPTTRAAQLGKDGALSALRVVLLDEV
jgi:murein DD-endopeptidase MepM/ murein hydrolase activator NlpD